MLQTVDLPQYGSSTSYVRELLTQYKAPYILLNISGREVTVTPEAVDRMAECARRTGAGMVYSDYLKTMGADAIVPAPLIDIQEGSLRDDFDFGALVLVTDAGARAYLDFKGQEFRTAGFYQMRLAIQRSLPIVRVPQPLYTIAETDFRTSGQKQFDYVNPRNRDVQIEMEAVCTEHLRMNGGYLKPGAGARVNTDEGSFPVLASVIIPVRNRVRTIADAVSSALSQQLDGPFNVIVADNHSTDGTTEILADMAAKDNRLIHIIPDSNDLGIGGCWNLAVNASLPDHPDHALYEKYFPNGGASIFTFDIKGGQEAAFQFIDGLEIFSLLANVADVKSLVIHPATTTHSQLTEAELEAAGIHQNTIRLSIGTEHIDDIIADLEKGFAAVK